jgi:hypothetical protein
MTAAPQSVSAVLPIKRREWPRWSYWPARALALGLLWPIFKCFEWYGSWPRALGRGFTRRMFAVGRYDPAPNDVLIGSYFKSGTNWTMQTALQVAHRGRADFEHIHDYVPWYELPEKQAYAVKLDEDRVRAGAERGLRIIKTHLPMQVLGHSPNGYYIWVVRDPKDVFVSSYRFIQSVMMGPLMPSVDKWLDAFLSDDTMLGSWAEHVQGCWALRDEPNVLFLTFEEMKADGPRAIERMARLLGVDLTAQELAAVIERSSFDYMKSIGHKFDTMGISPPWVRPRGAMVRRGARGSASELLGPAEQARIDDYWRQALIELGSDFPYDELYVRA